MNEEALFHQALGLSPQERSAFLAKACADQPALLAGVQALLDAHDKPGHPLDDPSLQFTVDQGQTSDLPTRGPDPLLERLFAGRYKIREKLGEGGMGTVYVADQIEPVQRRVALKLIKSNTSASSALARFEQERQALALMDHPNIAKVFDAGVTQVYDQGNTGIPGSHLHGTPYFVMELIKGVSITRYCDEAKLTPRERLELMIPVCQAVQHAHQKGIIHRDLKPSNILVGQYDGKPVPKIIDFGVAKATGPRLTEKSVYTELGSIVGTLEYMSPEQADLNNLDIDTRTDVYALGVILYELLTGTVPFSQKEFAKAGLVQMLMMIKEKEPEKPSTKVSNSGSLPSVAASRKTEPKRLTGLLRGDLDWIVMKAMEKDRSRRYGTALGLAIDIQHYLAEEPVLAGPPSTVYRLRKFVKRHRLAAAAAMLITASLILGVIGTSVGLYQANVERKDAQEQRAQADVQRDLARGAYQASQENQLATWRVIDEFLIQIGDDRFSAIPEFENVRKGLVDKAVKILRASLLSQPTDKILRENAAAVYRRSANLYRTSNQFASARQLYDDAIALMRGLVHDYPDSENSRGLSPEENLRGLSSTLTDYGSMLLGAEGPASAGPKYQEALSLARTIADNKRQDLNARQALALALTNYGDVLRITNRHEEAINQLHDAAKIFSELADAAQASLQLRFTTVFSWNNLAQAAREGRQFELAENAVGIALERGKKNLQEMNNNPNARYTLAWSNLELGLLRSLQSKPKEAKVAFDESLVALDQLIKEYAQVASFRRKTAEALTARSQLALAENRLQEAAADSRRAIELLEKLDLESPGAALYHSYLARAYHQAGRCALGQKENQVAKLRLDQAQQRFAKALAFNPAYAQIEKESQENQTLLQSIK